MNQFDQPQQYSVRDLDVGIVVPRIQPRADDISRLTHEGLKETNQHTLFDAVTFQRFVDMDCPRQLSMTHPDSPFEGKLWIAKLVPHLFVADDYLEVHQVGEQLPETPDLLMIEWNLILFWSFRDDSDEWITKLLGLLDKLPAYRKSIDREVLQDNNRPVQDGNIHLERVRIIVKARQLRMEKNSITTGS